TERQRRAAAGRAGTGARTAAVDRAARRSAAVGAADQRQWPARLIAATRMSPPREMSLTPELVALCYRQEEDRGLGGPWTRLTEAEHDAIARRLLDDCG